MLLIGVDPGTSGAIAFRVRGSPVVRVFDMPKLTDLRRKRGVDGVVHRRVRTSVDLAAVAALIDAETQDASARVFLEQVGVMPHDGGIQAFGFGVSYGGIKGVIAGLFLSCIEVRPVAWKKALKVSADKNEARARASELLPQGAHLWPLKKHDGRAEAAMLTVYGETWLAEGEE